jgi:hypothetical protein
MNMYARDGSLTNLEKQEEENDLVYVQQIDVVSLIALWHSIVVPRSGGRAYVRTKVALPQTGAQSN